MHPRRFCLRRSGHLKKISLKRPRQAKDAVRSAVASTTEQTFDRKARRTDHALTADTSLPILHRIDRAPPAHECSLALSPNHAALSRTHKCTCTHRKTPHLESTEALSPTRTVVLSTNCNPRRATGPCTLLSLTRLKLSRFSQIEGKSYNHGL